MSKKLSRKQIKEDIRHDEFQSAVSTTYEKIEENKNLIIGVIVAIVVLAIGFSLTRTVLANRAVASANELAKAIRVHEAPVVEDGAKPDDPTQPSFASDEERRTRAREAMEGVGGGSKEVANLFLAGLALEDGDSAGARERWERFLRDSDDTVLAIAVRINLIRLDREEGKAEEVVERLTAELDSLEKTLPEDVLLFELGQTLDHLGRGEEATEYYQRIVEDHPQSPHAAAARQKTT